MIVYHGSIMEIQKPDISFSKKYLDFGKGFYVTTYQKQAEKWALRKGMRTGKNSVVNMYNLQEDMSNFRLLNFEGNDEAWLDFVCGCRQGEKIYQEYDIIIGNVADDDVFKTVDMYFRGIWDKNRAIAELKYYKKNNQIAFVNQEALDTVIKFKESYKVV